MRYLFLAWVIAGVSGFSFCARGEDAAPLYVDARAIKERFSTITDEDMDMLRGKKILFGSQSFGANMAHGLVLLAKEDKKYDLVSSYQKYSFTDWSEKAGADKGKNFLLTRLPADVFSQFNFVHFGITIYPWSKRTEEMDTLIRCEPHSFGRMVDAAMIFFHTGPSAKEFEYYAQKMDAMQADFPKIRFIYCASGLSGPKFARNNENSFAFSELVRARYKGKVPLYDMGKILSDDYRDGHVFCREYSNDPADLHPNLPEGEKMLAKGFLLVLRDAFRAPWPPEKLPPLAAAEATAPKIEVLPASHPDVKAVRAILDANGLTQKEVEGVSAVENGRIVKLYLKECGVTKLPDSIGVLTELRLLHLYGDRKLGLPLLKTIDPAIGNCTKIEELLLNDNDLATLPDSIVKLGKLTHLSLGNNRLAGLSPAVTDWAGRFDPKGLEMQQAPVK